MKTKLAMFGLVAAMFGTVLVLFFSSFKPQDTAPQYVTLNAFDNIKGTIEPRIVIAYENNSTEEIAIEKKMGSQKAQIDNAIKIHETINMLSHKGYKLITAVSYPNYVSYIFERRNP